MISRIKTYNEVLFLRCKNSLGQPQNINQLSKSHVLFNSDELFTIVEPEDRLVDAYLKKVGKTREDFAPREPEKLVLQENETIIDDDYEPEYLEEWCYNKV